MKKIFGIIVLSLSVFYGYGESNLQKWEKDFDEILKLKQDIWNNMDNKEWYFIDETNKEFLKRELENG